MDEASGGRQGRAAKGPATIAVGIIAGCMLLGVAAVTCWLFGEMIMFGFAGVLVAILMRSLGLAIHRFTRLPERISLVLAILVVTTVVVGVGFFLGRMVESQAAQLVQSIPQALSHLKSGLVQSALGRWVLEHGHQSDPSSFAGLAARQAASMVTISLSAIMGLVMMVFLGLFVAFQPQLYFSGLVSLFPPKSRARTRQVLDELGLELRMWMVGQGLVMLIVGSLITIGLLVMHNQFALALGLFSALITFVPYLGAFVATAIAVLASVQQGGHVLSCTIILYGVVYLLEGYCITPLVQRGTVAMPPALTIIAQLALAVVFGFLGVVFAAPLLVTILVLVKMLYLNDTLGDHVYLPGEDQPQSVPTPEPPSGLLRSPPAGIS